MRTQDYVTEDTFMSRITWIQDMNTKEVLYLLKKKMFACAHVFHCVFVCACVCACNCMFVCGSLYMRILCQRSVVLGQRNRWSTKWDMHGKQSQLHLFELQPLQDVTRLSLPSSTHTQLRETVCVFVCVRTRSVDRGHVILTPVGLESQIWWVATGLSL